jgi:hypothetical protein
LFTGKDKQSDQVNKYPSHNQRDSGGVCGGGLSTKKSENKPIMSPIKKNPTHLQLMYFRLCLGFL